MSFFEVLFKALC